MAVRVSSSKSGVRRARPASKVISVLSWPSLGSHRTAPRSAKVQPQWRLMSSCRRHISSWSSSQKQEQRSALSNRQTKKCGTYRACGGEHLREQGFAFAACTIEPGCACHRYPVRDEPLPLWDGDVGERCGI